MSQLAFLSNDIPNENSTKIKKALSQYTERYILNDGSIEIRQIENDRFLRSDSWTIDMFADIPQFREAAVRKFYGRNKPVYFAFHHENLNLEAKFVTYTKVFSDQWSISNLIANQGDDMRTVAQYMADCHKTLSSFLQLNEEEKSKQWIDWLAGRGMATHVTDHETAKIMARRGKKYAHKTYLSLFLSNIYKLLVLNLDTREEWEKDGWDVRNLKKYGITHNQTALSYYMYFDCIEHPVLRKCTKEYIRHKLENKSFAWNTARMYMSYLPMFFNVITGMEPEWTDLKNLERRHIEAFIVHLNQYIAGRKPQKRSNPEQYKNRGLTIAHKFLSDMQLYEHEIAPLKDVRTLIFTEDKPKIPKKAYDKTDYIPDYVLEQLFSHINDLHPDAVPVVWIMYKTGLRISDALLLKHDCLVKLGGKYWLEADIEKTYVKGHRVPIDEKLADIIAQLINISQDGSNQYKNPEYFVFARLSGSRRGKPLGQYLIREYLNKLAWEKNIVDETGKRYHFTNHAFRHTYAVKLLNGGADIITIQELLAHASPEMTMRYARLLDDTKRQVFDRIVAQGVFSFNSDSGLVEENHEAFSPEVL